MWKRGKHTIGINSSNHATRQRSVRTRGGLLEELLIGFKVRHFDCFSSSAGFFYFVPVSHDVGVKSERYDGRWKRIVIGKSWE